MVNIILSGVFFIVVAMILKSKDIYDIYKDLKKRNGD